MKTITIVLIVLFVIAGIFFIITGVKAIKNSERVSDTGFDTSTAAPESTENVETAIETEDIAVSIEEETEQTTDEDIKEIKFYLDGNKENGIFLGNADYGLKSDDAAASYGEDFSNFGFKLDFDASEYKLEPGSIHSLYVYTLIPAYGEEYIRKEITIPGSPEVSGSIKMSSESLQENDVLDEDSLKNVKIDGWAFDANASQGTGISKVEIYLNGPRNFGKLLDNVQYGIERPDVANAFGNANFTNSGYRLDFDARDLDNDTEHRIYIYAYSQDGSYQYLTMKFSIEDGKQESNAVLNLNSVYEDNMLKISGWAINKNFISHGVPKSPDIEYKLKKIVFVSNKSGNEDIWSMNLDGSELTQLTDNPESDQYPSISSDGKKIIYASYINGIGQIAQMNWDGSDKKQITFGQNRHAYPSWSFDGRYIFFEMFVDDNWEIYVMESDGSNMKRLTINPGVDDWHPSAHPFKYMVLYEVGHHGNEEIWKMDINGEDKDKVSKKGRNYRVPKYSIDAKKIAFMGYDKNNKEQVFIMDADGGDTEQLTFGDEGGRIPNFSPDNKLIAYNSTYGFSEIFIMNIDGSDIRQLTDIPGEDSSAVFMYQTD